MSEELLARKEGKAGRLLLNRPKALNALNPAMCKVLRTAIEAWRHDDDVSIVIIEGAGEKAFCAGGDIRLIYTACQEGDGNLPLIFWAEEYRLNAALASYPKPIVSFLHGYVMGGGVGIGCHLAHRVVDPRAKIAMPECGIGLIPDVGGTWLLGRAPGWIGEYMGLTGDRISGEDAVFAGFADHLIDQAHWDTLIAEMVETGDARALQAAGKPVQPWASERLDLLEEVFSAARIEDIVSAAQNTPFAEPLGRNSPLSMAATLSLVRSARQFSGIEEAIEHEFRFTSRACTQSDLLEGIRSVIIDKDNTPRWRHPSVQDVPEDLVTALLAPVPDDQTVFPEPPMQGHVR